MSDYYRNLTYTPHGYICALERNITNKSATPCVYLRDGDKVWSLGAGFDAFATFRGVGGGARELRSDSKRAEVLSRRDNAKREYERLISADAPAPVPAPVPVPAPTPVVTPAPRDERPKLSGIEAAIVDAVNEYASTTLLETITPNIEAMVGVAIAERVPRPVVVEIAEREPVILDGVQHEVLTDALSWLVNGENVLLTGEAGTGKKSIARSLATALGVPFYLVSKISDVFDLKGYMTPKLNGEDTYQTTPFYEAYVNGGLVCGDEFDAWCENATLWAQAALDNGYAVFPNNPNPVKVHPDFYMVATANTSLTGADDMYTGRNRMDGATGERFVMLTVGYSRQVEDSMTADKELLEFVRGFRGACVDAGINHIVSYRAIRRLDRAVAAGIQLDGENGAIRASLTKHLEPDDIRIITNRTTGLSNNRYMKVVAA